MRITDPGEEEASNYKKPSSAIMNNLKTGSVVRSTTAPPDPVKIPAAVDSTRLKSMLANIKQNN